MHPHKHSLFIMKIYYDLLKIFTSAMPLIFYIRDAHSWLSYSLDLFFLFVSYFAQCNNSNSLRKKKKQTIKNSNPCTATTLTLTLS